VTTSTRVDLKIIGDNSASGGKYNHARVIGDTIINGNLDCLTFECVGNSRINGDLRANDARIVGSVSVTGSLEAEEIRIAGNIDANGDVKAGSLVLRGGMDIKGGVRCDDVKVTGYATIAKNCETETFKSEGPLSIGGLLNAGQIDIGIHGRCRVSEIGGERIKVRRGHYAGLGNIIKALFIPADFFKGKLVTDSIEGDEIRLEDTKAKVVRGKNVMIGDRCEIDYLEYASQCRVSGTSIVKDKKQVN
jgi:cytoskeletal protein CcmA (bactofilin family)